ncbi:MAG: DeoR family transcriptional regulator [Candidatus Dojkabacteria bacterium]|nr:DeoR family transcriptional regulator [Candidatus Dojkabacteria bacterium]
MGEERRKDNGMGIIIGLAGFVLGAFLIKKIIQRKQANISVPKECKEIGPKKLNEEKVLDINPRQQMIFDMLKKNGKVSAKDLTSLVPSVSSRTLRRDMDVLVGLGVASQKGSTKSTYYKYIHG